MNSSFHPESPLTVPRINSKKQFTKIFASVLPLLVTVARVNFIRVYGSCIASFKGDANGTEESKHLKEKSLVTKSFENISFNLIGITALSRRFIGKDQ